MLKRAFNVAAQSAVAFYGSQVVGNWVIPHLNENMTQFAGQYTPAVIGAAAVALTAATAVTAASIYRNNKDTIKTPAQQKDLYPYSPDFNPDAFKNVASPVAVIFGGLTTAAATVNPDFPNPIIEPTTYNIINHFSSVVGPVAAIANITDYARRGINRIEHKNTLNGPQ